MGVAETTGDSVVKEPSIGTGLRSAPTAVPDQV